MGNLLYQLVVGGVLGVVTGRLGVAALRHIALPATGLYPLATVGFGVVACPTGAPCCAPATNCCSSPPPRCGRRRNAGCAPSGDAAGWPAGLANRGLRSRSHCSKFLPKSNTMRHK